MTGNNPDARHLQERLKNIRALLMDVDGVLTDGRIVYSSQGTEIKAFDVKDGYGITLARDRGLILGIITGRMSEVVRRRAEELGISDLFQGAIDKREPFEKFKSLHQLADEEIAYIGDDVFDLPVLRVVGFSAAPRNAHPSVKIVVDFVTEMEGGKGAVREVIDLILAASEND